MKRPMKRLCVFCGKTPSTKNREHILPQWLIAHTGPPNRIVRFGFDKHTGKPREFSYNAFAFPACEACNSFFSKLEHAAKPVLTKLLASAPLSKTEFHTLLDWFDKVRVGLWLAFYFLDKNIGGIEPKFHIASRIGLHDRMLFLTKVSGNGEELSFRGCDMPTFYYTPSCFSMIINNYCFINISSPFLFSQNAGFPYPKKGYLRDDGLVEYELLDGNGDVSKLLMPGWFGYEGTGIYQPMFRWQPQIPSYRPFYETDYAKANSLAFEHGVGEIFIETEGKTRVMGSSGSSDWVPTKSYDRQSMNPGISIHTINLQLRVDKLAPSTERLTEAEQKWWQEMYKTNEDHARFLIGILNENARRAELL